METNFCFLSTIPNMEAFLKPCSKTCFIVGAKVPRTRWATFSLMESSPALLYCLERSSNNWTNLAGNQPRKPFNSPIQQSSSYIQKNKFHSWHKSALQWSYTFWLMTVITSFLRNPNSSSSWRSKSKRALARLFLLRITPA